jgi:CheY-like chemotaxis protein
MANVSSDPTSPIPQESNPVQGYGSSTFNRLLVVDDNEDIHMVLGDRLKATGYVVLRANNGAEALEVLAMVSVVGVFLDLERPVMDGLTFLAELQQQHIPVPVIVMSAGKDRDKFLKAIQLGAMDYLKKPIDTLLLAQKCVRLFE